MGRGRVVSRSTTNKVNVIDGSNAAIAVDYHQGDTVADVLAKAGVKLEKGQTATLGRAMVKNPSKTTVKAGDTIVVAGKPSNG